MGFWAKKGEPVEVVAKGLNRLGYRSINYTFPIKFQSRDAKNLFSLPIAFLSRSRDMSSRLRFDWGLTVTCHAFNAQRLVNRLTPNSIDQGCFLAFWLPMVETYKLRATLHLWVREHLHLFVYLLVLAAKTLILSLVH